MRRAILRQLASLPPSQHQEPQAGAAPSPQLLPSSAVHLVLWGRADPEADALDFVVGLPKDLLEGLSMLQRGSLPEGYVLPIRCARPRRRRLRVACGTRRGGPAPQLTPAWCAAH